MTVKKQDNRVSSPKVRWLQIGCDVICYSRKRTKGISHFNKVLICLSYRKDLVIL